MNKLVLFDIDGTLLLGGNELHKSAFAEAFRKVFGINASIDVIEHAGKTDRQIIIEVLEKNGISQAAAREKMQEITEEMTVFFEKNIENEKLTVADGAGELLKYFDENDILMGLVTGNLEPIARGKMKKVGFNDYFKVGGFGSDDEKRANLVKIAIKRAEDNFGFKFENNVFLVGDTPRDILAGKEAAVKTIGVATGNYSEADLQKEQPDFILKDLIQKEAILKLLK
jgi:phosphoglycolate phosphatase